MGRKYTRKKKLKQADEFITTSHKVAEFVKTNLKMVVVSLVVACLVIGATWTWRWHSDKQAAKATAMFTRAVTIYTQTIIPGNLKVKKRDDGIPQFKSRAEKLKAAEEEFTKLIKTYGDHPVGETALAMRGAVRFDRGKYARAVADYEKYLSTSKDDRIRFSTIEGLIYAYIAAKRWKKAMETVKRLSREGERRYQALYHEARILAQQGKSKEAVKRYRKILNKATSQQLIRLAGERLSQLENT